jgi:hypothetical protein
MPACVRETTAARNSRSLATKRPGFITTPSTSLHRQTHRISPGSRAILLVLSRYFSALSPSPIQASAGLRLSHGRSVTSTSDRIYYAPDPRPVAPPFHRPPIRSRIVSHHWGPKKC